MSQRGALCIKEVPLLGGVPRRCPCKLVSFCSSWPLFPHYCSTVLDCIHRRGFSILATNNRLLFRKLTESFRVEISTIEIRYVYFISYIWLPLHRTDFHGTFKIDVLFSSILVLLVIKGKNNCF